MEREEPLSEIELPQAFGPPRPTRLAAVEHPAALHAARGGGERRGIRAVARLCEGPTAHRPARRRTRGRCAGMRQEWLGRGTKSCRWAQWAPKSQPSHAPTSTSRDGGNAVMRPCNTTTPPPLLPPSLPPPPFTHLKFPRPGSSSCFCSSLPSRPTAGTGASGWEGGRGRPKPPCCGSHPRRLLVPPSMFAPSPTTPQGSTTVCRNAGLVHPQHAIALLQRCRTNKRATHL